MHFLRELATRPLPVAAALFVLYGAGVAAAALAARWMRRPIPRAALFALALPPIAFLWPGFLEGRTPIPADHAYLTSPSPRAAATTIWSDDVARQFVPWARAVRLAWRQGEWPHRNRWNGCGMPLDANGQSAAYSPLTILGLLLPLTSAFTFWAAAKLFLALSGAWLWLRELGVSAFGAFFGAVAFAFSLAMTAWLLFPHTAVLALGPWMLFAIERRREANVRVRARAFALLTGLFFLLPLAGHLETATVVCAFAALWLVSRRILGEREATVRLPRAIAGAAVLALGLSAFSLLPQILAILASNRYALTEAAFWQPNLSALPHALVSRWTPAAVLFPRLLGDGIASPLLPIAFVSFPEMAQGHFGILAALFALLIFRPGSPRPAAEKALLVPLIFGLGVACGAWPFAELEALVPILNRVLPARFLAWVAISGSAIAAFELDRLARDLATRRRAILWPPALAAALGLLAAYLAWRGREVFAALGGLENQRRAYLLAALALAAGSAVVLLFGRRPDRFATVGSALLAVVLGGELFRQGMRLVPFSDPADVYPVTPLVRYLREHPGPHRVAGEGYALFPNVGVFAAQEDIRTHDPVERREYVAWLDRVCGYDPAAYYKTIRDLNAPAFDALGVRYLVTGPRAAAPGAKWAPVYSGRDGAIFENARARPLVFAADGSAAEVWDHVETFNSVAFRVRAPRPAVLVASLVDDGGWRARDESGRAIALGRASGPFLEVRVPAGDHRIRLDYASPGFRTGAVVSLATAAVAALLLTVRPRGSPAGRAA
ncbi:MAG TPA: YfhO family protein [Thermoanaerobaculia bacterium]|jgi:hypothetical protein